MRSRFRACGSRVDGRFFSLTFLAEFDMFMSLASVFSF